MSASPLPSREEAQREIATGIIEVVRSYSPNAADTYGALASGRLVDHEAIDYEAAGQAAWYVVAYEEGHIDEGLGWGDLIASDSQSFWIGVGKSAVAAAFGDFDE